MPWRGGRSRKLTARKGYYYAPTVAPDGTIILYRRAGGNAQIGYVHGVEPGLYWISADGGMGNLITEEGYNPRFNSAGDRIYYQVGGGLNKTVRSVRLDGGDVRDVFKMKYGVDALISPDERWVAFQELWNVYITPYPRTGDVLTLDKSSKAIPLKQVSRDAGTNLHWSRDSQRLHWTIGPQYFTRELKNTFAFVEGAPDSLPAIAEAGDEIELFIETDVPSGFVVLRGARIITMNGDRQVIEDGTIVVEGNRIVAVGPTGSVALPEKAAIIDCRGKTIMPGIIDVHAHAWHFGNPLTAQQNWPYYANLAYGITAMHDPSATTEIVFAQRELVESGGMVGPRVFSTGTILYGADGDFKAPVESLEDARSHLRRMKAVGAFSVKSYNQPRRDQRQQVMQAARELQMMVYPEGGSFFYHNMSMILDGHTGIEHNIPVVPAYDDILTLWSSSGTANTPTLVVSYGSQSGERYWYQHMNVWDQQRLLNFMPRALLDAQARRVTAAVDEEYGHFENAAFLKAFTDRGGRVNVGGHGQLQGLAPHWEMWMFAQGGMTPMEVLAAATVNGAYYLGMEDDLGSLAPGKLADLLVLDKNPLENIRHSDQIQYVMKNGRIYDAMTMNEIGNHPRKRHRFWWEHPHSSDAFVWRPGLGFGQIRCGCGR